MGACGHQVAKDDGGESFASEYDETDPSQLPIAAFRNEIVSALRLEQPLSFSPANKRVLVCTGETGSGKTTQIPQFLADDLGVRIAVTQPRRVAAQTVAHRVCEERSCRLGSEVGYCVRFDDRSSPNTKIKYLTDGMLVRESITDQLLKSYGIVMLDEAHERGIHTDILFGLLLRALKRRSDLRVVVTSATLNVGRFVSFFGGCKSLIVPGRTHHVDVYHSKTKQIMTSAGPSSSSTYVKEAVATAIKLHNSQDTGHILVFLTGQEQIEQSIHHLKYLLNELEESSSRPYLVLPLYGALPSDAQAAVFQPAPTPDTRKIIVCTNIAETSVTVPGVRFVVDAGYGKQKAYDPIRRIESLVVVPISQTAAKQRAGRAGRTAPGQCYRLYSKSCYSNMMPEMVPEILRTSISHAVLYLKSVDVVDVLSFEYLDPPDEDQVLDALLLLYWLGALDDHGELTPLGSSMSGFPVEPSLAHCLLSSSDRHCSTEMLTIIAMLSTESVWHHDTRMSGGAAATLNRERMKRVEHTRDMFRNPLGDTITYLTCYNAWMDNNYSSEWAHRHFISIRSLNQARRIRRQLANELARITRREEESCGIGGGLTKCRKSICDGFWMNGGESCVKQHTYRSILVPGDERGGLKLMQPSPSSSILYGNSIPKAVVYVELVSGERSYMQHVTSVERAWLQKHTDKVRKLDSPASRLCGRTPRIAAALNRKLDHADVGNKPSSGITTVPPQSTGILDKDAVISAARERFLKRKIEKNTK